MLSFRMPGRGDGKFALAIASLVVALILTVLLAQNCNGPTLPL